MLDESSQSTGQMSDVGMTYAVGRSQTLSESMLFVEVTHANQTATQTASINPSERVSRVNSCELLAQFVRDLWSEKTLQQSEKTHFGRGGGLEKGSNSLDTVLCHSGREPVVLVRATKENGCSCLRSYPTPTASDWKGSTGKGSRRGTMAEKVAINSGTPGKTVYPNPYFLEVVMGFPIKWTELEDLETQSFPKSQNGSDGE